MSRALIVLYFLVLLITLVVTTRTIQGPWLFLFRAFFPNWKFYHSLGWQPQLHVRVRQGRSQGGLEGQTSSAKNINSAENQGDWSTRVLVYPRAKRNVLNLFHNPDVNIALANQNLVEHLANDLQQLSDQVDPKSLVSYQLVNRFVRHWIGINLQGIRHQPLEYQFEIRLKLNSPQIKARMLERRRQVAREDSHQVENSGSALPPEEEMHTLMISPVLNLDDPAKLDGSGGSVGSDPSLQVGSTQNFEDTTQLNATQLERGQL